MERPPAPRTSASTRWTQALNTSFATTSFSASLQSPRLMSSQDDHSSEYLQRSMPLQGKLTEKPSKVALIRQESMRSAMVSAILSPKNEIEAQQSLTRKERAERRWIAADFRSGLAIVLGKWMHRVEAASRRELQKQEMNQLVVLCVGVAENMARVKWIERERESRGSLYDYIRSKLISDAFASSSSKTFASFRRRPTLPSALEQGMIPVAPMYRARGGGGAGDCSVAEEESFTTSGQASSSAMASPRPFSQAASPNSSGAFPPSSPSYSSRFGASSVGPDVAQQLMIEEDEENGRDALILATQEGWFRVVMMKREEFFRIRLASVAPQPPPPQIIATSPVSTLTPRGHQHQQRFSHDHESSLISPGLGIGSRAVSWSPSVDNSLFALDDALFLCSQDEERERIDMQRQERVAYKITMARFLLRQETLSRRTVHTLELTSFVQVSLSIVEAIARQHMIESEIHQWERMALRRLGSAVSASSHATSFEDPQSFTGLAESESSAAIERLELEQRDAVHSDVDSVAELDATRKPKGDLTSSPPLMSHLDDETPRSSAPLSAEIGSKAIDAATTPQNSTGEVATTLTEEDRDNRERVEEHQALFTAVEAAEGERKTADTRDDDAAALVECVSTDASVEKGTAAPSREGATASPPLQQDVVAVEDIHQEGVDDFGGGTRQPTEMVPPSSNHESDNAFEIVDVASSAALLASKLESNVSVVSLPHQPTEELPTHPTNITQNVHDTADEGMPSSVESLVRSNATAEPDLVEGSAEGTAVGGETRQSVEQAPPAVGTLEPHTLTEIAEPCPAASADVLPDSKAASSDEDSHVLDAGNHPCIVPVLVMGSSEETPPAVGHESQAAELCTAVSDSKAASNDEGPQVLDADSPPSHPVEEIAAEDNEPLRSTNDNQRDDDAAAGAAEAILVGSATSVPVLTEVDRTDDVAPLVGEAHEEDGLVGNDAHCAAKCTDGESAVVRNVSGTPDALHETHTADQEDEEAIPTVCLTNDAASRAALCGADLNEVESNAVAEVLLPKLVKAASNVPQLAESDTAGHVGEGHRTIASAGEPLVITGLDESSSHLVSAESTCDGGASVPAFDGAVVAVDVCRMPERFDAVDVAPGEIVDPSPMEEDDVTAPARGSTDANLPQPTEAAGEEMMHAVDGYVEAVPTEAEKPHNSEEVTAASFVVSEPVVVGRCTLVVLPPPAHDDEVGDAEPEPVDAAMVSRDAHEPFTVDADENATVIVTDVAEVNAAQDEHSAQQQSEMNRDLECDSRAEKGTTVAVSPAQNAPVVSAHDIDEVSQTAHDDTTPTAQPSQPCTPLLVVTDNNTLLTTIEAPQLLEPLGNEPAVTAVPDDEVCSSLLAPKVVHTPEDSSRNGPLPPATPANTSSAPKGSNDMETDCSVEDNNEPITPNTDAQPVDDPTPNEATTRKDASSSTLAATTAAPLDCTEAALVEATSVAPQNDLELPENEELLSTVEDALQGRTPSCRKPMEAPPSTHQVQVVAMDETSTQQRNGGAHPITKDDLFEHPSLRVPSPSEDQSVYHVDDVVAVEMDNMSHSDEDTTGAVYRMVAELIAAVVSLAVEEVQLSEEPFADEPTLAGASTPDTVAIDSSACATQAVVASPKDAPLALHIKAGTAQLTSPTDDGVPPEVAIEASVVNALLDDETSTQAAANSIAPTATDAIDVALPPVGTVTNIAPADATEMNDGAREHCHELPQRAHEADIANRELAASELENQGDVPVNMGTSQVERWNDDLSNDEAESRQSIFTEENDNRCALRERYFVSQRLATAACAELQASSVASSSVPTGRGPLPPTRPPSSGSGRTSRPLSGAVTGSPATPRTLRQTLPTSTTTVASRPPGPPPVSKPVGMLPRVLRPSTGQPRAAATVYSSTSFVLPSTEPSPPPQRLPPRSNEATKTSGSPKKSSIAPTTSARPPRPPTGGKSGGTAQNGRTRSNLTNSVASPHANSGETKSAVERRHEAQDPPQSPEVFFRALQDALEHPSPPSPPQVRPLLPTTVPASTFRRPHTATVVSLRHGGVALVGRVPSFSAKAKQHRTIMELCEAEEAARYTIEVACAEVFSDVSMQVALALMRDSLFSASYFELPSATRPTSAVATHNAVRPQSTASPHRFPSLSSLGSATEAHVSEDRASAPLVMMSAVPATERLGGRMSAQRLRRLLYDLPSVLPTPPQGSTPALTDSTPHLVY